VFFRERSSEEVDLREVISAYLCPPQGDIELMAQKEIFGPKRAPRLEKIANQQPECAGLPTRHPQLRQGTRYIDGASGVAQLEHVQPHDAIDRVPTLFYRTVHMR
jgi:hypothetical protein